MDIKADLRNLIQSVKDRNTSGAKKIIHNLLDQKAKQKLADKKVEVTKNLFRDKE